ncbi:MAG TPA: hypothetical protein VJQ54_18530 [Candidatus Sulfotelmatobacter sp.]|nr:hypothetical protein [Candidatus Sulfotelmatobacter sp.]
MGQGPGFFQYRPHSFFEFWPRASGRHRPYETETSRNSPELFSMASYHPDRGVYQLVI